MKRNKLLWLALVPVLTALVAGFSQIAYDQNIGAVLNGASSIVTAVVVFSVFIIQIIWDSERIRSTAQNIEIILSKITQMETALKNSEDEKRILEENAQLHRNYLEAVAHVVQLMQENQALKAQLDQEERQNTDFE